MRTTCPYGLIYMMPQHGSTRQMKNSFFLASFCIFHSSSILYIEYYGCDSDMWDSQFITAWGSCPPGSSETQRHYRYLTVIYMCSFLLQLYLPIFLLHLPIRSRTHQTEYTKPHQTPLVLSSSWRAFDLLQLHLPITTYRSPVSRSTKTETSRTALDKLNQQQCLENDDHRCFSEW